MKKTFWVMFVMAILVCVLASCGASNTVNLNDYVKVDFAGYDTAGTAFVTTSVYQMVKEHPSAFGLKKDSPQSEIDSVTSSLNRNVIGSLSKETDLSNGETVTYIWGPTVENLEELYKGNFVYSNINVKVEGLEKADLLDLFQYVDVTFSGVSLYGTVNLKVDNTRLDRLAFTADKSNDLTNGDVITVTASLKTDYSGYGAQDLVTYCSQYGGIPAETERKYTVSGLGTFAKKLEDIPEETLQAVVQQTKDSQKADMAARWSDDEILNEMECIGFFLLNEKYPSPSNYFGQYGDCNQLYSIFKMNVSNSGHPNGESITYYYYGKVTNVIIEDDGACSVDLSRLTIPKGHAFWGEISGEAFWDKTENGSHYYDGYPTLDGLVNSVIISQLDKYSYSTTVEGY